MANTHLAVRTTAQRRTCKDCGKKSSGLQSLRSRAACPATQGEANRTGAVGEVGVEVAAVVAGWAAEGSGTGMKTPRGCSPSRHKEENQEYRIAVRRISVSIKYNMYKKFTLQIFV